MGKDIKHYAGIAAKVLIPLTFVGGVVSMFLGAYGPESSKADRDLDQTKYHIGIFLTLGAAVSGLVCIGIATLGSSSTDESSASNNSRLFVLPADENTSLLAPNQRQEEEGTRSELGSEEMNL